MIKFMENFQSLLKKRKEKKDLVFWAFQRHYDFTIKLFLAFHSLLQMRFSMFNESPSIGHQFENGMLC